MARKPGPPKLLQDIRVYLSGPMDFVASRASEKRYGWRNRVGEFMLELGATVFDPWYKPEVRGFHEYGNEDVVTTGARKSWTFAPTRRGVRARAACAEGFWDTMHIDLRMVDTSDFVVAYCPTNIYSVGTPHEIIVCRQQHKPVLFVSPSVRFNALRELTTHLKATRDAKGLRLLQKLSGEVPIRENARGIPSLWYMPLVGSEHFFDGFGFARYREAFGWPCGPLDEREEQHPPKKPLLPFIEALNQRIPRKWDRRSRKMVPNDDWLLWNLRRHRGHGAQVEDAR